MKYSTVIILTSVYLAYACNGQNKTNPPISSLDTQEVKADYDSLKKYSYFLYGLSFAPAPGGNFSFNPFAATGFVIESNGRYFLVSAKHVLTPCLYNNNGGRRRNYPDTINLRIPNPETKWMLHPINTKQIRDTVTCYNQIYEDPDVFIVEIPAIKGINTINKFITKNIDTTFSQVYIPGYHTGLTAPLTYETIIPYIEQGAISIEGTLFSDINKPVTITDATGIHYADNYFQIQRKDTIDLSGTSGSPIFIKSNKTNDWAFGGVYIGRIDSTTISVGTNYKAVLKKIEYLINNDKHH